MTTITPAVAALILANTSTDRHGGNDRNGRTRHEFNPVFLSDDDYEATTDALVALGYHDRASIGAEWEPYPLTTAQVEQLREIEGPTPCGQLNPRTTK